MFTIPNKYMTATLLTILAGLVGCGEKEQPKPQIAAAPPAVAPAPPPAAAPAPAPQVAATPTPAPAAPAPAQAAAPAAPAHAVLASQEFSSNPDLRCDVLEVKRVSGGALLVKWRLSRPPAPAAAGLTAQADDKKIRHNFYGWQDVYVTDPAENKKYSGLKDSTGAWIGDGYVYGGREFAPGQQQVMWMKFPAPPPSSTKISFILPGFPPFDDLPIAQ